MSFVVVAALRAVAKALWRVGDCEARDLDFPDEFGASQKRHYTGTNENRFGQHALTRIIHEMLKSATVCERANPHPDPLPSEGRGEISSPRLRGEDQGEGLFERAKVRE